MENNPNTIDWSENNYEEPNIWSWQGRIRRRTFWTRWLIVFLSNIVLQILADGAQRNAQPIIIIILLVLSVFIMIQGIKRMHDIDKSGWYILIPIYNIVLACEDGTRGDNRYGADPKGRMPGVPYEYPAESSTGKADQAISWSIWFVFVSSVISYFLIKLVQGRNSQVALSLYSLIGLVHFALSIWLATVIQNKNLRVIGWILVAVSMSQFFFMAFRFIL